MRSALVLAVLLLPLPAAVADPPDARALLDRYYAVRLKQPFVRLADDPKEEPPPPPWEAPLAGLKTGTADERTAAAALLKDLAATALADETSGTAPWRNTPFWGGRADVPARTVREAIADRLGKADPPAEVLPLLAWYLDREPMDATLGPVLDALGKLDGEEASKLRAKATSHPNAGVVKRALGQMADRKQSLPADALLALCHHHREPIRTAARKLNQKLGGKDPGAFDPVKAIRAEPVKSRVAEVLKLLPDLPARDAEFVTVTVRYLDDKGQERDKDEENGWKLGVKGDVTTIFTPHGREQSFTDKRKLEISVVVERTPNSVKSARIAVTTEVTTKPTDLKEVVKQVTASRKGGDAEFELSERGALTGQFQGRGAGVFEITLAAWLYQKGDDADAAAILLPAFDSYPRDAHLVETLRHRLGELTGQKMLAAFAGDRDYKAVLKYAERINALYPDTRFHRYAKGLAEQLPKRLDDFAKHRLPTADEWAKLKPTLKREEQIDYLASRLRLLNCFQHGQPGGCNPYDKQYAEPGGMADDASFGGGGGKTGVINPLSELAGCDGGFIGDGYKTKGLELTLKDVPALSKHLKDDWYQPTVSFWRNFHPDRTLSTTRPAVANIIDGMAARDLCEIERWGKLTPKEIDAEIDRINKWAAANADKSKSDLRWSAFQDDVKAAAEWRDVEWWVKFWLGEKELSAERRKEVVELALKHFRGPKATARTRISILDLFAKHDPAQGLMLAEKHLSDPDESLRLSAALLVFRGGDKGLAREALGDALAASEPDNEDWRAAAELLLKDGSEESLKQAARLFANPRLATSRYFGRASMFAACTAVGLTGPYRFYRPLLDNTDDSLPVLNKKGEKVGVAGFNPSVAAQTAEEIVNEFAKDDPAVKKIAADHPKTADQIPHLKKWLDAKLDKKK